MPVVGADGPTVIAKYPDPARQALVRGHHRARVAKCPEILARIEAEAAGQPDRPRSSSSPGCPVSLGGVLDHRDAGLVRDPAERIHVGHLTVEVHDDDSLGSAIYGRFQQFGGEQQGVRADIGEPWRGAGQDYRFRRGDERVRGSWMASVPLATPSACGTWQ